MRNKLQVLLNIWERVTCSLMDYEEATIIIKSSLDSSLRKLGSYCILSIRETESRRFAAVCKLISILIKHLKTQNQITTIRDIYYQDVEVFSHSQKECRFLLDQFVECGLGWSLCDDLNIHPTQKGLVYGDYFHALSIKSEPILIPINYTDFFGTGIMQIKNKKVLVVILEKDAVYQCLCTYLKQHSIINQFLIVTAKGYSDGLTLRFLTWLRTNENCKFMGFFDSDVYGLNIYWQYRQKLPGIEYSGIYLLESQPSTWLSISLRDISMMINICKNRNKNNNNTAAYRELTRGLYLFKKAEMNVVQAKDTNQSYVNYMVSKILGTASYTE